MSSLVVKFSDTVIKRHLKEGVVTQLRDERFPLRLRFNKAHTGGTWYVVSYKNGKTIWKKVAKYPLASFKFLEPKLGDICFGTVDQVVGSEWSTLGGLLEWYGQRVSTNRNLSNERKATVKSAIKCHLMPRLGDVRIADINHSLLDSRLMWPMQADYSVSHVESVWRILKAATNQAVKLKLIESNPLSKLKRTDFISVPITPKGTALRSDSLPVVFDAIQPHAAPIKMLVLLMLLHGTRIGETRKARWSHFDLSDRTWFIPTENTKTRTAHRLPLTDLAYQMLIEYRDQQLSAGYDGVYLFQSADKKAVSAVVASEWVRRVSKREWSGHDLRKLARTAWADLGIDYMVGEMLLNHSPSKMDKAYIHTYAEKQIKSALEIYHGWLIDSGINMLVTEKIPRFDKNVESLNGNDTKGSEHNPICVKGEDNKA